MKRDEVVNLLATHRDEIARFDVERLALFGSIARDTATAESDVDFLVHFRNRPTFKGFMGLTVYLEDLLERPVDLLTEASLDEGFAKEIEPDLYNALTR